MRHLATNTDGRAGRARLRLGQGRGQDQAQGWARFGAIRPAFARALPLALAGVVAPGPACALTLADLLRPPSRPPPQHHHPFRTIFHAGALAFCAALVAASFPIPAHAQSVATPLARCLDAGQSLTLGAPLPRTTARLKAGGPLTIVAIGSSSTSGFGAMGGGFPAALRDELTALRPGLTLTVVNSGRLGDTIPGMIRRFGSDVAAHAPDLVIWQLGTNDVVWGGSVSDGLRRQIGDGIAALRAQGADVVLMDLQYAPAVLRAGHGAAMQEAIVAAARAHRAGLFPRHALTRRAIDGGVPMAALVSWDGLHHTGDGYACIGRTLARMIVRGR